MSTAPLSIDTLRINGAAVADGWVELAECLSGSGIAMTETMTGAGQTVLTVQDTDRKLIQAKQVASRSTMTLDAVEFELCAVGKSGRTLQLTFEDRAVARLRTHRKPTKIGPGKMTRAQFCKKLIGEESWIKVVVAPGAKSLVELARGTFDTSAGVTGTTDEPENTWDAVTRIMGEIGWRAVARRGTILLVPDTYLLAGAGYALKENTGGVDEINFDYDIGKPAATASFSCRTGFANLQIATPVTLSKLGPASGKWLISEVTRSPFSFQATVSLMRPQPTLPEPAPTGTTATSKSTAKLKTSSSALVNAALKEVGKKYKWGKAGPSEFDCSGLVLYCAKQLGVTLPHQSGAQYATLKAQGKAISVAQALKTPGALLFIGSTHVAISVGDGVHTIEAENSRVGVVEGLVKGRGWTSAATL